MKKEHWAVVLLIFAFLIPAALTGEGTGASGNVSEINVPATVYAQAVRIDIPTTITRVIRINGEAGDCGSWSEAFTNHGASQEEIDFFIGRGILLRETGCGMDLLNEHTGDSGVCQINPVHNRAGYFGRRAYGDGGWLQGMHGLHTREMVADPAWIDACLTLFRVCGEGPWVPGSYSCLNRRYP